jgi:Na+/proline symporter
VGKCGILSLIDWIILISYYTAVVAFGIFKGSQGKGLDGYFRGNRKVSWWVVGLSVMATQASAITFVGTTGQAYAEGMTFIQMYLAVPLVMVTLCVSFVPFFYKADIYTAYEFLERRFDGKTRTLTSLIFLVQRSLAVGIVIYAPSVVLAILLGWDERTVILLTGAGAVLYTAIGGVLAVAWTDAIQMLLMFAGVFIIPICLLLQLPPGISASDAVFIGGLTQKWAMVDFTPDLSRSFTIYSGILGGLFLGLSYFGCDQSQVQRYITAASLRESRISLLFNGFAKIPMQLLILATGVLLFVFFHFQPSPLLLNRAEAARLSGGAYAGRFEELSTDYSQTLELRRQQVIDLLAERRSSPEGPKASSLAAYQETQKKVLDLRRQAAALASEASGRPYEDINYIYPTYIFQYLPVGLVGIMIAVIFSAASSTITAELTALSSVTMVDFYRRFLVRHEGEAHYMLASRLCTLFWGAFAVAFALYAGRLGSLIVAVNKVGSYFYGSLLGVFILAIFFRKATALGAFVGLVSGMAVVYATSELTTVAWLYYNVIGTLVVLVVGLGLSAAERFIKPGR